MIAANSNGSPAAAMADESCDYVTVTVGEQLFGLPIEQVHDVFIPTLITMVPLAPAEIVGLLNLRGRIVTALCLRRRLGLPPRADSDEAMAVGLEFGTESYGLLVDSVGEVLRLAAGSREPTPMHLDQRWSRLSRGVHRLDGKLLIVLDVAGVLALDAADIAA
jgi:purine-binding chemotaxis protein CheW